MKLRVEVVWENEGEEQRSHVMAIERPQLAMETLGLNLGESKAMLEGLQDIVVAQQVAEDLEQRRRCLNCGERYRSTKRSQNIPAHAFLVGRSDEPRTSLPGDEVGIANPIRQSGRFVAGSAAGR